MPKVAFGALAALTLFATSTSYGQERTSAPMPAGYDDPGPPPEDVLAKVVARLRTTLSDPYSIRDLTLCPLDRGEAFYSVRWHRAQWTVRFTLNSRNSHGGYTGSTMYTATFEDGEVTEVRQFTPLDLITPAQNARLIEMAQACPRVPDAEIQRLLAN
jgi:hypothetical protein